MALTLEKNKYYKRARIPFGGDGAKSDEIIFPHLYAKTIPNENLFGHIKMGNKEFIAGSYLCLECGQGGTFNEQ